MKFAVHFFGCKVNQYDAARWTIGLGKNYVAQPNDADIIVLFSCVVTHKAEAESKTLCAENGKLKARKSY